MPKRRPQLRACSVCQKTGHNKSRCPELLKSKIIDSFAFDQYQTNKPPVKFFIHDEKRITSRSPHLLDLKPKHDHWNKMETSAPEKNENDLFYFHHEIKNRKSEHAPVQQQKNISEPRAVVFAPLLKPAATKNLFRQAPRKIKPIKPVSRRQPTVWRQFAFRAALVCLCVAAPFKAYGYYSQLKIATGSIAANSTEGFMALQESTAAIMQADLDGAQKSTLGALDKFNIAVRTMNENARWLQKAASVIPVLSNEVQSRQKLITAGQKIALGNAFLIKGVNESQNNETEALTDRIKTIADHLEAAVPNYQAALDDLSAVDADVLPLEYQAPFNDFRLLFTAALNDFRDLTVLGQTVQEIFGGQGLRRYLIVFQNPHEMRPTGGFIGSFALLDVKDGKIVNLEIPAGGSYDLQGQLDTYLEPPTPLLLSNKRWEFQDANWFPDFPASAEKILWFYRHSRDMTADGVIAVNATMLEKLLAVVGPIEDEKRQLTLTSDNAVTTIQKVVEEGPEKADNKPKQIIADLAPRFVSLLSNAKPEQALPLLVGLSDALKQKEIQAYFTDESSEETMRSFGWSGQIAPTKPDQDYLLVVNTNIQGQKTDAKIKQSVSHQAVVQADGSIIDTVVITRQHEGAPGEKFYGQDNFDYIRLYVPLNSELVSAGGFVWPDERKFRAPDPWAAKDKFLTQTEKEISIDANSGTRVTEEFGKTAFGNWLILRPGETGQVQFTYRLPFKAAEAKANVAGFDFKKIIGENDQTSRYQLVVQRQSGQNSDFESQIIYPAGWHPAWSEGDNVSLALNGMSLSSASLVEDGVWSLLMKKEN